MIIICIKIIKLNSLKFIILKIKIKLQKYLFIKYCIIKIKLIYIKQFLLFFQIIIHLIKNKFQKSRFKNHSIGSNPSVIL